MRNIDYPIIVLSVEADQVEDLYGAEMTLRYDPEQMQIRDSDPQKDGVQINPGPFADLSGRFVSENKVMTDTGMIQFSFIMLAPAPPINADDILASVEFELLGEGPYEVLIDQAQFVTLAEGEDPVIAPLSTENFVLEPEKIKPFITPIANNTALPTATIVEPSLENTIPPLVWGIIALLALAIAVIFVYLPRLKQALTIQPQGKTFSQPIPAGASTKGPDPKALIRQGNRALDQSNQTSAYSYFSEAVQLDPANPEAWLGKGLSAQQVNEKRICFQRVLALEPDNHIAQQELEAL